MPDVDVASISGSTASEEKISVESELPDPLEHDPSLAREFKDPGFAYVEPRSLPPKGKGPSHGRTEVDIIGVPAIGGHPKDTWIGTPDYADAEDEEEDLNYYDSINASTPDISSQIRMNRLTREPWLIRDLRKSMPSEARVLLYNHGAVQEGDQLEDFTDRFLKQLQKLQDEEESENRPLIFACHSTGGLVVKSALIKIKEDIKYVDILARCFGVAFFSTPHKGSSYLSAPAFSMTMAKMLRLIWYMPRSLQQQLYANDIELRRLAAPFSAASADLRIWTFFEALDSDLTDPFAEGDKKILFQAPIVAKKSAILELSSEIVSPLISTHADSAGFGGRNGDTKKVFLADLRELVMKAIDLCKEPHVELNVKEKVQVEIHGFIDQTKTDVARASSMESDSKSFIRVWSTYTMLPAYRKSGPRAFLKGRLAEKTAGPHASQYFRRAWSRARSLTPLELNMPPPPTQFNSSMHTPSPMEGLRPFPLHDRRGNEAQPPNTDVSQASGRRSSEGRAPVIDDSGGGGRRNSSIVIVDPRNPQKEKVISKRTRSAGVIPPVVVTRSTFNESEQSGENNSLLKAPAKAASRGNNSKGIFLAPDIRFKLSRLQTRQTSMERNGRTASDTPVPPLVKPNINDLKFTWIHLPFNNPPWVADVLTRLTNEKKKDCNERLLQPQFWDGRHIKGRQYEYPACYVEPGCILVRPYEDSSPIGTPTSSRSSVGATSIAPPKAPDPNIQLSLYLPYLHWDTYKKLVKRRDVMRERLKRGRARPVPERVGDLDLEHQVFWMYLAYSPPFNCRRTLDQFGYPSLVDTRARDDDQMIYKKTREPSNYESRAAPADAEKAQDGDGGEDTDEDAPGVEEERREKGYQKLRDGRVLMVDQLWLYVVDEETISTFFPKRQFSQREDKMYSQADLRDSIYNEVNSDLSDPCENALDLAGLVVYHAVVLLFKRESTDDLKVFVIMEESISALIEKMTKAFKYFRAKGFRASSDSNEDEQTSIIIKRHKEEGRLFQEQFRDNTSALLELRDIADELTTLKKLFKQQRDAIEKMQKIFLDNGYDSSHGASYLRRALHKLDEYDGTVKEMLERTEASRTDFEKLLELIQRQANVDEARLTRWQADLTNAQTRAVTIFTVFTVIFLPLSFFTSLFGMNVTEFVGTSQAKISMFLVAKYSLPVSIVLILLAFIVAWSTHARRWLIFGFQFALRPREAYDPLEEEELEELRQSRKKAAAWRRRDERDGDEAAQRHERLSTRWRTYKKPRVEFDDFDRDFWADLKDKGKGWDNYHIPVHNWKTGPAPPPDAGRAGRAGTNGSGRAVP